MFYPINLLGVSADSPEVLEEVLILALLFSFKAQGSPGGCPSAGSTVGQSHGQLDQITRDNIIPEGLQKRWKSAKKIKFPLGVEDSAKGLRDIFILRSLSKDNVLAQAGLPIGQMTIKNTSVIIEGVVEAGGETKEVILSVEGRKYWVELKSPEGVSSKVSGASIYRSDPANGMKFRGHIQWEDAGPEMRAWLNGPDAIGIQIKTREGGFFTRVDDERFRHLGPSWKDEETGLIWSHGADSKMDYDHAIKFCKDLGGERLDVELPTKEMFEVLSKKNGHTLFADNNNWWWSSSVRRGNSSSAWLFDGDYGNVDFGHRDNRGSVRCVAR